MVQKKYLYKDVLSVESSDVFFRLICMVLSTKSFLCDPFFAQTLNYQMSILHKLFPQLYFYDLRTRKTNKALCFCI